MIVNALHFHLAAEEIDDGHEKIVYLNRRRGYGEGVDEGGSDHDPHGGDGGYLGSVSSQQVAHSKCLIIT